ITLSPLKKFSKQTIISRQFITPHNNKSLSDTSFSEDYPILVYTLNLKCIISPSHTTYSLPSTDILPASLQACSEPYFRKSSYLITSARIKPFSKSVWITPAACGAKAPLGKVHALTSFSPAVK